MAGDTSSVRLASTSQIVPPKCSYREPPAPASRISPGTGYRLPFCLGHYVDYNAYDSISYAQNNTGRGGGR
jgi:hypothetical protein